MEETEVHQRAKAHEILAQPSLIQMKDLPESNQRQPNFEKHLNKLKKLIEIDTSMTNECNDSLELFSLKDIILDKDPKKRGNELFFKLPDEPKFDEESVETALVLRRTTLLFKGKRCTVLNF